MMTTSLGYLLAVAATAATVMSQSLDSYSSPATYNGPNGPQPHPWPQPQPQPRPPFNPERPSPDVCYQQHSASDCREWGWCVWDPYSNTCSNERPAKEGLTVSAFAVTSVSSPEIESQLQPQPRPQPEPEPQPRRPSPAVCEQQHSKADCSYWNFCQWNSATNCCTNPRPVRVEILDSTAAQPAALIASDSDSLRRPSPDVCSQQREEDDCTLWSFCTWDSDDQRCSKQIGHYPGGGTDKLVSDFVATSNQAPPQPQPSPQPQPNPQPDFCGKQQSKAGCVFWLWCQWDDATHFCWSKQ